MVGLHLKRVFNAKSFFPPARAALRVCIYAFLPYITVFLTNYMQGSKPLCLSFPRFPLED